MPPKKSSFRKKHTEREDQASPEAGSNKKARKTTKKVSVQVQALTHRTDIPTLWDEDNKESCFKVVSWNVNGIRALIRKHPNALSDLVVNEDYPDVIFLQETKLQEMHVNDQKLKLRSLLKDEGYENHWTCSTAKKGYSGSAVFIRTSKKVATEGDDNNTLTSIEKKGKGTLLGFVSMKKKKHTNDNCLPSDASIKVDKSYRLQPIEDKRRLVCEPIEFGLGKDKHDEEGRTIICHYPLFSLTGLYVPNSGAKLERLHYRTKEWDKDLLEYMQNIETKREVGVIWLGDLNVAHTNIDVWNDGANHIPRSAGTTPEERKSFTEQLENGYVDMFRHLHPEAEGQYTFWAM